MNFHFHLFRVMCPLYTIVPNGVSMNQTPTLRFQTASTIIILIPLGVDNATCTHFSGFTVPHITTNALSISCYPDLHWCTPHYRCGMLAINTLAANLPTQNWTAVSRATAEHTAIVL